MSIAYGGQKVTFADGSSISSGYTGFKNRIINGAMVIDQRNAGASYTVPSGANYTVDRWQAYASVSSKYTTQQNAGSITPPTGFNFYLGATSSSAYSVSSSDYFMLTQKIEGYNSADLGWGTANAKTVTLSFWVQSSLTGTFGGAILNGAQTYSYPFSYTISSANTWTQVSVTVVGPTSGTWIGATNGIGIFISFGLGMGSSSSGTAGSWSANGYYSATGATSVVGTNGATFYITGVQLEAGSQATSFDYRDFGRELIMCQRYYEKSYDYANVPGTAVQTGCWDFIGGTSASGNVIHTVRFAVTKRATGSTVTAYSSDNGAVNTWGTVNTSNTNANATPTIDTVGMANFRIYCNTAQNMTIGRQYGHWTASSEL